MSPTVSLIGIKDNPTLLASSLTRGTDEGKPVVISANKTAALASDGNSFCGIIETIAHNNSVCVVRKRGFVQLAYTGADPSLGYGQLAANATGGVKTGAGLYYWVYDVDTDNLLVTFDLG